MFSNFAKKNKLHVAWAKKIPTQKKKTKKHFSSFTFSLFVSSISQKECSF
jgi:hypothetical protein